MRDLDTPLDVLRAMLAAFDSPQAWCRGREVGPQGRCRCIYGNLSHQVATRVPSYLQDSLDGLVSELLESTCEHPLGLAGFNDDALTTFKDVRELLIRAATTLQPAARSAMSRCR